MKSGFSKCPFLEGSEPGKEPYKLAAKEVFDEIIDAKGEPLVPVFNMPFVPYKLSL